ncbi:MarR family winged helix-turn-helix transcriptional regulator [Actomonas aquatica]|uniref:MarR family transcriptional regulator n=1 Tax=Actomonas aquatica TaxID=2866162 RepID=A0ABZ1C8V2_9BACT|nr:MarR family transcriptional regulator [Opitutus sp. WL0086]WRQ87757.1 MarR family transcriptional regulator [Opitutus sp. WL0086]
MNLLRSADELFAIKSAFLNQHNISNGRFTVLLLLSAAVDEGEAEPPARGPAELAEMAGVTRATMTGLIDTLEKDGYVRREPDPRDRRAMLVHVTPKGEAFTNEVLPGYFRRVGTIMAPLDATEREELLRLIMKLREGIAAAGAVDLPPPSTV